jgi:tetratricopeptide (TPR) repeat protein
LCAIDNRLASGCSNKVFPRHIQADKLDFVRSVVRTMTVFWKCAMSDFESGFPPRVEFDDQRPPIGPRVTLGRLVVLGLVLVLVGLVAAALTVAPDGPEGFAKQWRRWFGAPQQNIERRFVRHLQRKQYDEALKDLDELEKLVGQSDEILLVRSDILARQRKYREAIGVCDEIIRRPTSRAMLATALNNRSYFRALIQQDLDAALEDIDRAIELGGEKAEFLDTRGYLRYLHGQHKTALGDFNKILNRTERFGTVDGLGEIYFHRGLVYQQLGENKMAQEDFQASRKHGYEIENYPQPIAKTPMPQ